jgi:tRNA pseudouridine38-40 synthase
VIKALRSAGFERNPVPAGRTDLGVHARMQVLSMRVPDSVPTDAIAARLNACLPPEVGIAIARDAPPKFHAQWQSAGKEYRYRLLLKDDEAWAPYAWRVDVNPESAHALLQRAVGTHDFYAFHDKSSRQMPRTLRSIELAQVHPHVVELRLLGAGFARYMVRYLVGSAVGVARGEVAESDFLTALVEPKSFAGVKAPPQGLVLWEVRYPPAMDPFTATDRERVVRAPFF